jgi:hypothetical protein
MKSVNLAMDIYKSALPRPKNVITQSSAQNNAPFIAGQV